jgi:hypothetical protein
MYFSLHFLPVLNEYRANARSRKKNKRTQPHDPSNSLCMGNVWCRLLLLKSRRKDWNRPRARALTQFSLLGCTWTESLWLQLQLNHPSDPKARSKALSESLWQHSVRLTVARYDESSMIHIVIYTTKYQRRSVSAKLLTTYHLHAKKKRNKNDSPSYLTTKLSLVSNTNRWLCSCVTLKELFSSAPAPGHSFSVTRASRCWLLCRCR